MKQANLIFKSIKIKNKYIVKALPNNYGISTKSQLGIIQQSLIQSTSKLNLTRNLGPSEVKRQYFQQLRQQTYSRRTISEAS